MTELVSPHCWLTPSGLLVLLPGTKLAGEGCLFIPSGEVRIYRVKGSGKDLDRYLLTGEWPKGVEFEEVDLERGELPDYLWLIAELKRAKARIREPELLRSLSELLSELSALALHAI